MSLEPLQHDAQLHYAPKDHSWVTVDDTVPFFAQASYIVNPDDISISLSAANINVDLDQTNAGIQTINTNLSAVASDLNTNISTVNINLSAIEETLVGIDIDLNTNISTVNANLSTTNTNLGNLLNYNNFVIPPFDNIALTNNADGNPLTAVYSKDSTTVATLTFTYDGSGYMTNAAISYPA